MSLYENLCINRTTSSDPDRPEKLNLTLPVQIPHPTWAMVKYPTPRGLPEGDIEVWNSSAHNICKKGSLWIQVNVPDNYLLLNVLNVRFLSSEMQIYDVKFLPTTLRSFTKNVWVIWTF